MVVFVDDDPGVVEDYADFIRRSPRATGLDVHGVVLVNCEAAENFALLHVTKSVLWVVDSMMCEPMNGVDGARDNGVVEFDLMYAGVSLIERLRSIGKSFRFMILTHMHAADVTRRVGTENTVPVLVKDLTSPKALLDHVLRAVQ
jgi:DNA-binding NarL/FixJ family response regulator